MRLMGIDYGTKRVGIAFSEPESSFVFPHDTLENDDRLVEKLLALIAEKEVGEIVVGESTDLKGEDNPVMDEIRVFKEALEKETKLPVHFEKEIFTSAEARRLQDKDAKIDASAAALILQGFIDRKG